MEAESIINLFCSTGQPVISSRSRKFILNSFTKELLENVIIIQASNAHLDYHNTIYHFFQLNQQQISWLQGMSAISVRQTLKYHCFNSVPYPKLNTSSAIKLLTWNDVIIEAYPTKESPFFYSVPPETDGCVVRYNFPFLSFFDPGPLF